MIAAAIAAEITRQTDNHILRLQKAASIAIELIANKCTLRNTLDTHQQFLTDGYNTWCYIVQVCSQAATTEQLLTLRKAWTSLRMDEVFALDKFNRQSMHSWIEYVEQYWKDIALTAANVPTTNEHMDVIVNGLSEKAGAMKVLLLSSMCPTRVKYANALVATNWGNNNGVITLAEPARVAGEWKAGALKGHLIEQWELGIDNKTIHVKGMFKPSINFMSKGKPIPGIKPTFTLPEAEPITFYGSPRPTTTALYILFKASTACINDAPDIRESKTLLPKRWP